MAVGRGLAGPPDAREAGPELAPPLLPVPGAARLKDLLKLEDARLTL